jgi:hypothetical protein
LIALLKSADSGKGDIRQSSERRLVYPQNRPRSPHLIAGYVLIIHARLLVAKAPADEFYDAAV